MVGLPFFTISDIRYFKFENLIQLDAFIFFGFVLPCGKALFKRFIGIFLYRRPFKDGPSFINFVIVFGILRKNSLMESVCLKCKLRILIVSILNGGGNPCIIFSELVYSRVAGTGFSAHHLV